jgi:hypothetical protein
MLRNGRENMNRQLVGVRIIYSGKFYARVHERVAGADATKRAAKGKAPKAGRSK